jgi:Domain of unknown function (DUF4411)
MTTYLLDADVFIQAKNAHYGFDIVPAFWNWLDQAHAAGTVYTVEKVAEEVMAGGDDLATWMKHRPKSFKVAPANNDQPSLTQLAAWATNHATYSQGAVARFLAVGDYYLVAQAHSLGYAVATHETPAPGFQEPNQGSRRLQRPRSPVVLAIPDAQERARAIRVTRQLIHTA